MTQCKSKMRNFLLKVCVDIVDALMHILFCRKFRNHQFLNKKCLPLFSDLNRNRNLQSFIGPNKMQFFFAYL